MAAHATVEGWTLWHKSGPLVALAYVLCRSSRRFSSIGLSWSSRDAAMSVPVALSSAVLAFLCYPLASWASQPITAHPVSPSDLSWSLHGSTVTTLGVLADFLNGFFEELIVRAYLMTEVLNLTQSAVLAILCSVALQISYHFYQGAPSALGHIGWCLLFSVFYVKTRRILPLALAHNFTNFTIHLQDAAAGL